MGNICQYTIVTEKKRYILSSYCDIEFFRFYLPLETHICVYSTRCINRRTRLFLLGRCWWRYERKTDCKMRVRRITRQTKTLHRYSSSYCAAILVWRRQSFYAGHSLLSRENHGNSFRQFYCISVRNLDFRFCSHLLMRPAAVLPIRWTFYSVLSFLN
jgi:hypothetical protein